jgi:hypothetical protein
MKELSKKELSKKELSNVAPASFKITAFSYEIVYSWTHFNELNALVGWGGVGWDGVGGDRCWEVVDGEEEAPLIHYL